MNPIEFLRANGLDPEDYTGMYRKEFRAEDLS